MQHNGFRPPPQMGVLGLNLITLTSSSMENFCPLSAFGAHRLTASDRPGVSNPERLPQFLVAGIDSRYLMLLRV
jgi:hypothetical protein